MAQGPKCVYILLSLFGFLGKLFYDIIIVFIQNEVDDIGDYRRVSTDMRMNTKYV